MSVPATVATWLLTARADSGGVVAIPGETLVDICRGWEERQAALQAYAPNRWAEPCRTCAYLDEEPSPPECEAGVEGGPGGVRCLFYEDGR